jgi:hypothetical protein
LHRIKDYFTVKFNKSILLHHIIRGTRKWILYFFLTQNGFSINMREIIQIETLNKNKRKIFEDKTKESDTITIFSSIAIRSRFSHRFRYDHDSLANSYLLHFAILTDPFLFSESLFNLPYSLLDSIFYSNRNLYA